MTWPVLVEKLLKKKLINNDFYVDYDSTEDISGDACSLDIWQHWTEVLD